MNTIFEAIKQLILGITILLFSIFGLTYLVPYQISIPKNLKSVFLSPAFWPSVLLYLLGILATIIIIKHIILLKKQEFKLSELLTEEVRDIFKKSLACAVIIFVSFFDIELIGLPIVATIVMFALYFLAEKKFHLVASLVMLVTPWVLYFFFTYVADVYFPLGFVDWR